MELDLTKSSRAIKIPLHGYRPATKFYLHCIYKGMVHYVEFWLKTLPVCSVELHGLSSTLITNSSSLKQV